MEADAVARVGVRDGGIVITALLAAGKSFTPPDAGHLFNYDKLFGPISFPILVMMVVTVLIALFFISAFRSPKVVPTGSQNVAEAGVDFVEKQIMLPVLGPDGRAWMPFLTAMFFWVFFLNIMGIIPGIQFPITSRMALPADRKSTRLNSSHLKLSRMPSSA